MDWTTYGFKMGHRSIKTAYLDSKKAFKNEIEKQEQIFEKYKLDRASGKITDDEEEIDYVYFGEHIGENIYDIEQHIKLLREAFINILYHFWEKEACKIFSIKRYNQDKIFEAAKGFENIKLDKGGLNKIRMIVNCIKHDNGDIYEIHPELFDDRYLPEEGSTVGWQTCLQLTDDDLETAFRVVSESGPRSLSPPLNFEELPF